MHPTSEKILEQLKSQANPANVEGMARYGINPDNTLGVSMPVLRAIARQIRKNHPLALELWDSGIHEARILAALIADPKQVDEELIERWVHDFDSWDVCDQVCSNLFDKTPFAYHKAVEWAGRQPEYVKRAGFVLMAALAVHDKKAPDQAFEAFFPIILREAVDERNFVKKAVNWALRGIGKRNRALNIQAIDFAQHIAQLDSRVARWIASDALRELTSSKIQAKLA
ncbi:MAG: DNA alkylation repair protein [Anaerolineales bacterium]